MQDEEKQIIITDKYGFGKAASDIAGALLIAFIILFIGQCSGCVDILGKF